MGTIFGLQPFTPKRTLILPCEGGEVTLYVLDGKAYPATAPGGVGRTTIHVVHFEGWAPSYKSSKLQLSIGQLVNAGTDLEYYPLEVAFRLVAKDGRGQTAEIVAVSCDGGKAFYENEHCTLPREYER